MEEINKTEGMESFLIEDALTGKPMPLFKQLGRPKGAKDSKKRVRRTRAERLDCQHCEYLSNCKGICIKETKKGVEMK